MRAYFKVLEKIGEKKFKGQGGLIMNSMRTDPREAKTVDCLANDIADELVTRQDPKRVVMFYISTWLKDGYVAHAEATAPSNVKKTASEIGFINNAEIESAVEAVREAIVEPEQLRDLSGMKLSEAVLEIIKFKGSVPLTVDEIVETFQSNCYDFSLAQVNSAVGNLTRKNLVTKVDGKVAIKE